MQYKINIVNKDIKIPEDIIRAADGDELLARIFYNRGYREPDTIRQMLHEEFYVPTKPYDFPGMGSAVSRIEEAIRAGEPITVYGDYDVDGVTSTATLVQGLGFFTSKVDYHVPDRFSEGYGMNVGVIKNLAERGTRLIVTCDCGISNHKEISAAKELGMDVIVTDHHNIPDTLPPADIILNPKLLGKGHRASNLSGCGMAYFLMLALLEKNGMEEKAELFHDLLAMSLVADVVSLNGENRYLLKKARPNLFGTKRIGLQELFGIIGKENSLETEEDIAFQIAPRINAAGRMDTARIPVELMLCRDIASARELAVKIDFLNSERKKVQQDTIKQAIKLVEDRKKNKTVLVLFGEYWHHGVIGIAAGKICELYGKPAILLSMKEDGTTAVGSARSVEGIDIYELIKECSGKLLKFGGHPAAAGLSLKREDVEAFASEIESVAEKKYFISPVRQVNADMEMEIQDINERLYERLSMAGPYGEGFEQPVFLSKSVTVASDRKTEKKHHIMVLTGEGNTRLQAVKWFGGDEDYQGKVLDIAYTLGRNTYRGNNTLQLTLDCIVPKVEAPVMVFDGDIIDGRKMSIDKILDIYKDVVIFYEGLESRCTVEDAINRNTPRNARNLVFLSTPANTYIFREVIALVNPQNVIINFSALPDYNFKHFVLNLMGYLKHITEKSSGRSWLEQLAAKLCVEETIIRAALKYIKAAGKIDYYINDDSSVQIYRASRAQSQEIHIFERNLQNALSEKYAYQQFILKAEIGRFKEYLK